jgi:hypothetical protein
MRKMILGIFLSTTTLVGFSQDVKPDNGLTKNYSSNFLGSWSWEKGSEKFRLNLISANLSNGIRLITGSYLYIVNNKEIIDASLKDGTFWIIGDLPTDSTKLTLAVVDKSSGKHATATLIILDTSTILWKLNNAVKNDQSTALSIPGNITLKKQN